MRVSPVAATLAVTALGLAGCGTASASDPLTGSTWQLLSIESMTTEQPTTTIEDPSKYTVTFGDDGRAAFLVDCNRGNSSWEITVAAPDSGSLVFGPIATTRMMCPQPSSDAKVLEALSYVRSYLISDGTLHLSLLADSGIMHWAPAQP